MVDRRDTGTSSVGYGASPNEPLLSGQATEESPESKRSYIFTGKMGLFPPFILSTLVGSGILITRGRLPYSKGYFTSSEVYYGIAGLVLFLCAVVFLTTALRWLVFKITFVFTRDSFTVIKHGVYRKSRLQFSLSKISLHYLRTHFVEKRAWMALVVQEGNVYYRIFSWRGRGNQKMRFLKLFNDLQSLVDVWRGASDKRDAEIATREEVQLISPFTMRLRALQGGSGPLSGAGNGDTAVLCWEDCHVINFDSFFHHYDFQKSLRDGMDEKTVKLVES